MREGWRTIELGNVCKFENGDRGKNYPGRKAFVPKGVPFINAGHLDDGNVDWQSMNFIPREHFDLLGNGKIRKNDLLFCLRGSLGKFGMVDRDTDGAIASSLVIVRPTEELNSEFLAAYFRSSICEEMIFNFANGAAQPNLSAKNLKSFEIPLPPLPEQKRIVSILNEAFAGIDETIANTEKNLSNGREIFDSFLNNVFTKKGEGWVQKRLGDLTLVKSGGTPLKSTKEYWDGGEIPWYSSGELNDLYTTEPAKRITKHGMSKSNTKLFPTGSLLIGMYDTAALKMSILDRDSTFNQAIAGVEPNEDIDLIFIMNSIKAAKSEILSQRRGVRQKNLSLSKIKNIVIFMPSMEDQKAIVDKITALNSETDCLETICLQKLDSLNELKQSLLAKAFSGELTADTESSLNDVAV